MTARRFLVLLASVLVWAVVVVWLHCQYIHQCYSLEELLSEGERLTASYATLDARVSHLRQPHLLAQRVGSMQLGLVSPFEESLGVEPVSVAQVGVLSGVD